MQNIDIVGIPISIILSSIFKFDYISFIMWGMPISMIITE